MAHAVTDHSEDALGGMAEESARARARLVTRLAFDDYRHEWVLSSCSVLALAAVLIPLLVLFGLRYGIIANLLDPLVENPRYREIAPITSGHFTPDWFETMRSRDDVAFVVPRTRSLAATIRIRKPDSEIGRIVDVELILLVLFGLRYGIIANLLDPLVENPRYREIAPITSGHFTPDWFETMRSRDDVAFVVPRTRSLAATIRIRKPDSEIGRIVDVELI